MRFIKDFERKAHDKQRVIHVTAGSNANVEEFADGCFEVTTEKACTKNGSNQFDLHWFLVVVLAGVGIFFWCWWNANFGSLPPISDTETITKFAVIPTVLLGWIIGRMYAAG